MGCSPLIDATQHRPKAEAGQTKVRAISGLRGMPLAHNQGMEFVNGASLDCVLPVP